MSRWLSVAEVYSEPYQTSNTAQPAFTYSNLTIETVEQGEICSKLTIKTLERPSSVFIVNFEHIITVWENALQKHNFRI